MAELSQNDPATRAASIPRVVGINKTSSSAYGDSRIYTRASEDAVSVYEFTLEGAGNMRGFAVIAEDTGYSQVMAYAPQGSISDTTYNKGMAHYFQAMSGYLATIKENNGLAASAPAPNQTGDYWQPRSNGGWRLDYESHEWVRTYYDYDEFLKSEKTFPYPLYYVILPSTSDTKFWLGGTVAAQWRQEAPYNDKVQEFLADGRTRCRVGCGPIAMGQIMSYHSHPAYYNWGAIKSSPMISVTAPAFIKNAVSTLLIDIANKAGTDWDTVNNLGNTYPSQIVPTMRSFGYNVNQVYSQYSISEEIYTDLMAGRPVLLGSQRPDAHAWVVDGLFREYGWYYGVQTVWRGDDFLEGNYYRFRAYRSMLHCNWGWGDSSNGWYASMTPYYANGDRTVNFGEGFYLWNNIWPL